MESSKGFFSWLHWSFMQKTGAFAGPLWGNILVWGVLEIGSETQRISRGLTWPQKVVGCGSTMFHI